MARNTARPLSPHLQVYKWGPHMLVSIMNRAMGVGLATVGVAAVTWWLVALASGPAAYKTFYDVATSWVGYVVGVGLTFAWLFHLFAGVRHFFMDAGAGFELQDSRNSALASLIGSILATAAIWLAIIGKGL